MHATRYREQHGCDTQQQTVVGCDTQQQTVVDTGCSMHPTPPAPASWWPKCRLLPAPQTRTPVYVSRVHKCEYLHVRANMRANVPVCMYASTYVRVHVCMCVGIYVYMHICIYQRHAYSKHTYKHTPTHSRSHTHSFSFSHARTHTHTYRHTDKHNHTRSIRDARRAKEQESFFSRASRTLYKGGANERHTREIGVHGSGACVVT